MEFTTLSSVDNREDQWSPLAKGIYLCAGNSGWSILELAWRCSIDPELVEAAHVGMRVLEEIEKLTGYSQLNIRRIGLGLDPVKPS